MALHPPRTKFGQRLYLGTLIAITLLASAVFLLALPQRYSPIAPLDLDDKSGPFARAKIAALRDNPRACTLTLARSKLATEPAPNKRQGACGYRDALVIKESFYHYSQPMTLSCPMAAGLYVWEREVVSRAASRHLNSAVVGVDIFGTYSCRRRNGAAEGAMSEHASANAIDIAGFKLANGKTILVEKHWKKTGSPESAFLHEVRDRGCGLFQVVLSPDYNQAHHNHLHFDMGPYKMCA